MSEDTKGLLKKIARLNCIYHIPLGSTGFCALYEKSQECKCACEHYEAVKETEKRHENA